MDKIRRWLREDGFYILLIAFGVFLIVIGIYICQPKKSPNTLETRIEKLEKEQKECRQYINGFQKQLVLIYRDKCKELVKEECVLWADEKNEEKEVPIQP